MIWSLASNNPNVRVDTEANNNDTGKLVVYRRYAQTLRKRYIPLHQHLQNLSLSLSPHILMTDLSKQSPTSTYQ